MTRFDGGSRLADRLTDFGGIVGGLGTGGTSLLGEGAMRRLGEGDLKVRCDIELPLFWRCNPLVKGCRLPPAGLPPKEDVDPLLTIRFV